MPPFEVDAGAGRAGRVVSAINGWVAARSSWLLVAVVIVNLLVPGPARALRAVKLFDLPGLLWPVDFPVLALAAMMLSSSIQCRMADLAQLRRGRVAAGLALSYGMAPLFSALAAALTMNGFHGPGAQQLQIGLLFVTLMPAALTSAVWVRLASGNVALAVALVTATAVSSLVVVPLAVWCLPGIAPGAVLAPSREIVRQLVLSVALPLAVGLSVRRLWPARADAAQPFFSLLGNVGLFAALSTNVAAARSHIEAELPAVSMAAVGALALNAGTYGFAIGCARLLAANRPGLPHADAMALVFGGGMKSTGMAMVVGAAAFPTMPLVTVPAAIYSISQQMLASALLKWLVPGTALLRGRPGQSRRQLETHLKALRSDRFVLLLFRVSSEKGARPLLGAVQRRLRGYDFVSLVEPDAFAVVLQEISASQAQRVADRLGGAVKTAEPGARLSWALGVGHAGAPPDRLVEATARLARAEMELQPSARQVV